MKLREAKRWGVDIGNVLIPNGTYGQDLDPKDVKFLPDALEGLEFLINQFGSSNVFIISKATAEQQILSRKILESVVCPRTNLLMNNVRFCLERLDKFPIIQQLGLDAHIDDRGEIIYSIQNLIPWAIWFNPDCEDFDKWNLKIKDRIPLFYSWSEFMQDWNKIDYD